MMVLKLIELLGLTEDDIKVFEDSDWNEQRAARTGQRIMWIIARYEEILKKERFSRQNSMLDFFKSSSGTSASPSMLLDTGDDDPDDTPTVQEEELSP
jgi:hypothetical protein